MLCCSARQWGLSKWRFCTNIWRKDINHLSLCRVESYSGVTHSSTLLLYFLQMKLCFKRGPLIISVKTWVKTEQECSCYTDRLWLHAEMYVGKTQDSNNTKRSIWKLSHPLYDFYTICHQFASLWCQWRLFGNSLDWILCIWCPHTTTTIAKCGSF